MQIQCPKCHKWTDSENESCALCGAVLVPNKENEDKPSLFHEREIIDLDEIIKDQRYDKIRELEKHPDREIMVNGRMTTMREYLERKERLTKIIVVLIFIAFFLLFVVLGIAQSCHHSRYYF